MDAELDGWQEKLAAAKAAECMAKQKLEEELLHMSKQHEAKVLELKLDVVDAQEMHKTAMMEASTLKTEKSEITDALERKKREFSVMTQSFEEKEVRLERSTKEAEVEVDKKMAKVSILESEIDENEKIRQTLNSRLRDAKEANEMYRLQLERLHKNLDEARKEAEDLRAKTHAA